MMLRRAISGLNMKQGGVVAVVLAFLVRIKVSVSGQRYLDPCHRC